MTKTPMNMRLSDEARTLMKRLGQKLGIDETSVVEMAVRRLAEAEGVRNCEIYFQSSIDIGEEWQKELQDFDVIASERDKYLVFSTKCDDHCAAISKEYYSSILQRLGRVGRETSDQDAGKVPPKIYFCIFHDKKECHTKDTKESKIAK